MAGPRSHQDAALEGSRCEGCGAAAYPPTSDCPRCRDTMASAALSRTGTLWTWTVQRYPPKSPPYIPPAGGFEPFVVGYVELADGIRVEAVVDVPIDQVVIGMALELTSTGGVPHARVAS